MELEVFTLLESDLRELQRGHDIEFIGEDSRCITIRPELKKTQEGEELWVGNVKGADIRGKKVKAPIE